MLGGRGGFNIRGRGITYWTILDEVLLSLTAGVSWSSEAVQAPQHLLSGMWPTGIYQYVITAMRFLARSVEA